MKTVVLAYLPNRYLWQIQWGNGWRPGCPPFNTWPPEVGYSIKVKDCIGVVFVKAKNGWNERENPSSWWDWKT